MKKAHRIYAAAAACALLAACSAPQTSGSAPAAASPAPSAAAGGVPASSCYSLYADEYSQNTVLYGGGRVIYNGPGGAGFVPDAGTGAPAGYYVGTYGADRVSYTLYDLAGQPLLDCGAGWPDALLNGWVHLQYNVIPEVGTSSNSLYRSLKTGETRLEGYLAPQKIAEGSYLAVSPGAAPTSILLGEALQVVKDLSPWYVWGGAETLPGYLCAEHWEGGDLKSALFCIETGEFLEGFLSECGQGLACFQRGDGYAVLDLATGETLAAGPFPFFWYGETGWAVRTTDNDSELGYTVKLGGQEYPCRWFTRQDDRFLLSFEDDAELVLRADGAQIASRAALGAQSLSLLPGGYYTAVYGANDSDVALYSPEGELLARDSRYTYIYNQWNDSGTLENLFSAFYSQGRAFLCDLLAADGTPLLTGLNQVYGADAFGAAVRKGFSRGIMDYQGNWVWKENIFDSFEDEEEAAWW